MGKADFAVANAIGRLTQLCPSNCRHQEMAGAQGNGAARGAYWRMSMPSGWVISITDSPYLTTRCITSFPYLTSPCLASPCPLPYLTLPYLTLPYLTLPYLTLPYLTLPYLTLPYLTLFCLALPCLNSSMVLVQQGCALCSYAWSLLVALAACMCLNTFNTSSKCSCKDLTLYHPLYQVLYADSADKGCCTAHILHYISGLGPKP
jgi:hypothetical protein